MAKRSLAIVVVAVLAASGIFAQENEKPKTAFGISAGVGGFIGGDFGGGAEATASWSGQSGSLKVDIPYFGGGGYAFFDATYAELSFGFYSGGGTSKMTTEGFFGDSTDETDISVTSLNIGLLGKYPFRLGNKLSIFPLLGIDYQIVIALKQDGDDYEGLDGDDGGPGDFSALWFKLGGGLDFAVTEKLYLRGEALYGIRLANTGEGDIKDMFDTQSKPVKDAGGDVETKTLLGHGLTVKLAVGYRF
jgi:opacity protein-like surface antigen